MGSSFIDRVDGDSPVLAAMLAVDRHEFVPEGYRSYAYRDSVLPIGMGQTISAPIIVYRMTELLEVQKGDRILEIGTGSGFQAAVLAEMGAEVFSIEIIPELAELARENLVHAGYDVMIRVGDGYLGWEEYAPYDGIIVTAAAEHVPPLLRDQLVDGGRLVIPLGSPHEVQTLWLIERRKGKWRSTDQGQVRFVPFVREE
jgi:protein-L-isoaspartate(D-aspartate) O-methyltransferase